MIDETVEKLSNLNKEFYERVGPVFDEPEVTIGKVGKNCFLYWREDFVALMFLKFWTLDAATVGLGNFFEIIYKSLRSM